MTHTRLAVTCCLAALIRIPGWGAAPTGSGQTASANGWTLVVLGIAQDAGMPHLLCTKPPCTDVRAGRRPAEKVSSLGVVSGDGRRAYIFDATPDFPAQAHALAGDRLPDAIFLTHAHIGHYTGLMYLGKESVGARDVPVYGTKRMAGYLAASGPWSLLVKDGHVDLRVLEPDRAVDLSRETPSPASRRDPASTGAATPAPPLRVTPFLVPHRDEFTDTVGYLIEGPRARALFVPDIDRWEKWDRRIRDLADRADLLFLDGTFSSPADLGLREYTAIPHPMMPATRALLKGTRGKLWFIHLNHTNPELIDGGDVAREGMRFPL